MSNKAISLKLIYKGKKIDCYKHSNFQQVLKNTKSDPEHQMSINQRCKSKYQIKSSLLWDTFKAQATNLINANLDELKIERIIRLKYMMNLLEPLELTTNDAMKKIENQAVIEYFTDCTQENC